MDKIDKMIDETQKKVRYCSDKAELLPLFHSFNKLLLDNIFRQ